MSGYTAHLAKDADPRFTACGEPWQGWQEPENAPRVATGAPLPPHYPPTPHKDRVRFCQACASRARDADREERNA